MTDVAEELFSGNAVMVILRGLPPDESVALAERAWDLGIDLVEVPVQTPAAVASFTAVVDAGRERNRRVGAGTVITVEQVHEVAQRGAAFTVAPGLDRDVVAASAERGLAHLPGVATPSEIQQALRLRLTWLKAFPASVLGSGWFAAMRGPFPALNFVATGGINARNARDFLEAGARVVAVGSALSDPAQVDDLAALLRERGGRRME